MLREFSRWYEIPYQILSSIILRIPHAYPNREGLACDGNLHGWAVG